MTIIPDATILLVEDEPTARLVLRATLLRLGYHVRDSASAEDALVLLAEQRFDLMLTDLQLPGMDGATLMQEARAIDPQLAVIIITGYATLDSAIAAVRGGAANYILKPGRAGELEQAIADALNRRRQQVERLDLLRRIGSDLIFLAESEAGRQVPSMVDSPPSLLRIGPLTIDPVRRQVLYENRRIQLSGGEFSLLTYLARNYQQVVSPQEIAREVLGYECEPHEARDLIKSRIWSLRRKLEQDPAEPRLIVSVRGSGYRLAGELE